MTAILIGLFSFFLYIVPALVGAKKKHFVGIFLLNIFFGWSIFGWVIALIWAIASPELVKSATVICPACNNRLSFPVGVTKSLCGNCGGMVDVGEKKNAG